MNYYDEIKNELIDIEVYKRVKDYSKNKRELEGYYKIGKMLAEAGKHYGEGIIKEYSIKLKQELGIKYTYTVLSRMRQFYNLINNLYGGQNIAAVRQHLTWSHYRELLPIDDTNEINYYIKISIEQNLSYRQLHEKIKSNEYERLDDNTKNKLINKEPTNVTDFVKNPIIIRNKNNYKEMRKFYYLIEKMATVSPNLSYSHYVELLPLDNLNKAKYYVKVIEEQNLSLR